MKEEICPLSEYDSDPTAIIEPSEYYKPLNISERCVIVLYQDILRILREHHGARLVHRIRGQTNDIDVYEMGYNEEKLLVVCPSGGAPVCAAVLDIMIAFGCRNFIACGTAGVLRSDLVRGMVVIVDSAIRDEGTSFHYLPPSRELTVPREIVNKVEEVLEKRKVDYFTGKTWTTDAIYRETRGKIRRRGEEGCLTVEMECSALAAVAQFRGVTFGQYLAAGDDVSGEEWDRRRTGGETPLGERVFWLSVEACLSL